MTSTHRRGLLLALGLVAALAASPAFAQDGGGDHQAGLPLTASDAAAQRWTLESDGHNVCQVALTSQAIGNGAYRASAPPECGSALGAVAGWKPASDGATLLDGSGQTLIHFSRWSNSLLVAPKRAGVDLQLRRGA